MRWFWTRKEPEKRQSQQPFTDAIVASLAAQAGGTAVGSSDSVGALEMAAGAYSRAFAGATVKTDNPMIRKALSPAILGSIGRSLIRRGECIFLLSVRGGMVHLQPVGSWDVRGPAERELWMYRLDTFGPSGNLTHFVPSASVLHCMYSYDPAQPWLGLSPLQWGSLTGVLAAALESKLGQEASGPVGHALPMPTSPTSADVDPDATAPSETAASKTAALTADILSAKGSTMLVETTSAGHGEGRAAAPQHDWRPVRFGASPPDVLAVLNSAVGLSPFYLCVDARPR